MSPTDTVVGDASYITELPSPPTMNPTPAPPVAYPTTNISTSPMGDGDDNTDLTELPRPTTMNITDANSTLNKHFDPTLPPTRILTHAGMLDVTYFSGPPSISLTGIGVQDVYYPHNGVCINTHPLPYRRPTFSTMLACCKTEYDGQVSGE